MGYEIEMFEYHDDLHQRSLNKSFLFFEGKNIVTCKGISFRTLIWNYLCWVLAGKPKMKNSRGLYES